MIPLWGFASPNANRWAPLLTNIWPVAADRQLSVEAPMLAASKRGGLKMSSLYAVIRTRGPKWDRQTPMREQALWREHAIFVDGLEAEGVLRLAGPLEGGDDVLIICRGESAESVEARLAQDPWTGADMLHTTRISPWNMLVGELE
jgi:uncharacterized protein YciI